MPDHNRKPMLAANETGSRDPHRLLGFRLPLLVNIWSALATRRFARMFGLKQLEARVVFVVGLTGAVSLKSLVQVAGIEKAYASRTTTSLVETGLLAKTIDANDRRSVRLTLTRKGQALFDAILDEANARDDEWIGVLDGAEQAILHGYLDRLEARLQDLVNAERHDMPDAPTSCH